MRRPWPTGVVVPKINIPTAGCSMDIILLPWRSRLIRSQNIFEVNTNERILENRCDVECPT
jgi:hypothetical protein